MVKSGTLQVSEFPQVRFMDDQDEHYRALVGLIWKGGRPIRLNKFLRADVNTSFPIPLLGQNSAYCPMPKNSSTTIKQLLVKKVATDILAEDGRTRRQAIEWAERYFTRAPEIEKFAKQDGSVAWSTWAVEVNDTSTAPSHQLLPLVLHPNPVPLFVPRIYIVRDPISRFASAFRNRIIRQHKGNTSGAEFKHLDWNDSSLIAEGLNRWVTRITSGESLTVDETDHFAPQHLMMESAGAGPEVIYDISETEAAIRSMGLSTSPLRAQTGGPSVETAMLSKQSITLLKAFYKTDYRRLNLY